MQTLSKPDARRLILAAQGLAVAGTFGRGARATLAAVEHLGYVQIDTISVIQRAHHHVLWTRIPHYRPEFLHQLMAQREVFEYWSHAAAFLPMREYRYSLPRKRMYQQGNRHWFELTPEHQVWRRRILRQIREHGPQSARDFATPGERARSGWFDWKPAKQMLEQLFQEGVLMITARRGFEKVYDLAERVLPTDVDQRPPSPRMYAEHLLASSLRANGLSRPVEAAYLRHKPIRDEVARTLARGVRDGRLLTVQVENETFVADAAAFERLMDVPVGADLHILSPFDNLVIQRARLNTFFDFEYTLECYQLAYFSADGTQLSVSFSCFEFMAGKSSPGSVRKSDQLSKH